MKEKVAISRAAQLAADQRDVAHVGRLGPNRAVQQDGSFREVPSMIASLASSAPARLVKILGRSGNAVGLGVCVHAYQGFSAAPICRRR